MLLLLLLFLPFATAQLPNAWNITYFVGIGEGVTVFPFNTASVFPFDLPITELPPGVNAIATTWEVDADKSPLINTNLIYLATTGVRSRAPTESTKTLFFTKSTKSSPESCALQWEHIATAPIFVPYEVTKLLEPTEVHKATSKIPPEYTRDWFLYSGAGMETVIAYLDPTVVPTTTTMTDLIQSIATDSASLCSPPNVALVAATTIPRYSTDSTGTSSIEVYLPVIAIFPILFVLGFLENFYWFQKMMKGETALRGSTICWFSITLIAFFFIRISQKRKREEERVECAAKWKAMSIGIKYMYWIQWGFRWKYPEQLLGHASGRVGEGPLDRRDDIEMRRVRRGEEEEEEEQLPAYTPREEGKPDYSPPGVPPSAVTRAD